MSVQLAAPGELLKLAPEGAGQFAVCVTLTVCGLLDAFVEVTVIVPL